MLPLRIMSRILQIVIVTLIIMYFNNIVKSQVHSDQIPVGVVFDQDSEEVNQVFKIAIVHPSNHNRTRVDIGMLVDTINTADAFKLSRLICNQFARGVVAMLGAVAPDSFDTLHSYTNTFQIPFAIPWFPEKVIPPSSGLVDYAVSLRPDYHKAVIDTITYYGWKNVIYIYDSHDGLLRLQQLYQSLQPGQATFRISNVKRVSNAAEVIKFLVAIEQLDRWSTKYVVLDSTTKLAKEALILHVRQVQLGRRNYHYFLSGLVMDDRWEKEVTEFGAINITGFRVLDLSRKVVRDFFDIWKRGPISARSALMYDAVQVLHDAISRLVRKRPELLRVMMRRMTTVNTTKIIDCNPKDQITPYEHGDKISRMIKKTDIVGLTGTIRFNEQGHRRNFSLQVMEMTVKREMVKVATWYDDKGLVLVVPKLKPLNVPGLYDRNKTYIVSTIIEPPYVMHRSPDKPESTTNDPFKGFCVDLAKMLSDKLEIKYELRPVKDGKYGSEDPRIVGGWDGMIGELLRKEADMAIAPLLITVDREMVVDFTKPFFSFDVRRNKNAVRNIGAVFGFLHPLSKEIWLCILLSGVAVSVVLYIVSRFSPNEWRVVSFTDAQSTENADVANTKTTVVNEFSFWNSMWFSLGAFMQQGSEITPRSLSGRIVGTVWWFFALIVISSYTANLASYLTLSRIPETTQPYGKITTCPEDNTIRQKDGGIASSNYGEDQGWLGFLLDRSDTSGSAGSDTPCEMLVTITNSGLKDFAIALPKGSLLRDGINLALQSLKDDGELQKLIKRWFTNVDCDDEHIAERPPELTLNQVAGLFYVLIGGLGLAMAVALVEFCHHGRAEAARANVPLRAALSAKARLGAGARAERNAPTARTPQREHDRLPWNGGAYAGGFYMPANPNNQEETAMHGSFTQV